MCGEDGKVGGEGESLNKCSGFGAILFIRAGGCDVYRLVGRLRGDSTVPTATFDGNYYPMSFYFSFKSDHLSELQEIVI